MKKTNGDNEVIIQEYGIIEKLFPKYGFIRCFSRHITNAADRRLFFHVSAIHDASQQELNVGDYVTFGREVVNGKAIAKDVAIKFVELLEGVIVKMPKKMDKGSISYKFNDECFYLPFGKEDIAEDSKVKAKDEVTFEKSEQQDSSGCYATNVMKKYSRQLRVQGVVTSVKEKFGFIDRSDVVKEIYFNLSALPQELADDISPGDELEFSVKHLRNGKEEAVNVRRLVKGTVQFADIIDTVLYGTLLRAPDNRRLSSGDALAGNISYVYGGDGKVLQIPFGERDKKHPYSLAPGDIVSFKIAIDRRDQLQRACDVELRLDSFPSRKETRHLGVIKMFDGSAGLIEPDLPAKFEEDMLVAFKGREWLFPIQQEIQRFMVVSYTPMQVAKTVGDQQKITTTAVRIMPARQTERMNYLKLYPSRTLRGIVQTAASQPDDLGIIVCQFPSNTSQRRSVAFTYEDVAVKDIRQGDEVSFGCLDRIGKQYLPPAAFNIQRVGPSTVDSVDNRQQQRSTTHHIRRLSENRKIRSRTLPDNKINQMLSNIPPILTNTTAASTLRGSIVICKENFGFVETEDRSALYKFRSELLVKFKNNQKIISVGTVVDFVPASIMAPDGRVRRTVDSIINVVAQDTATAGQQMVPDRLGDVLKPLTISEVVTDESYRGLLRDTVTNEEFPFSMSSLVSLRTKLSRDDKVIFGVVSAGDDGRGEQRACSVQPLRHTGRVTSVSDTMVTVDVQTALPGHFEVDLTSVSNGVSVPVIDDIVQVELNVLSRSVFVCSMKPHKPSDNNISTTGTASTVRKVYKPTTLVEDSQPRVLHWRSPRLPEEGSIGFTEALKRVPAITIDS